MVGIHSMTLMVSFVIQMLVAFVCTIRAEHDAPMVNTLNGPIKGKYYETVFGREILAFHRIPYIKPPIGTLRFKDPQAVDNWTEVLDCSLPPIPSFNKNVMLFKLTSVFEGDEKAIHINAYSQNLTPTKLRPVMVWIHGGSFISDSAGTRTFAPDFLLEKDIVLFTFNYRLGVLGFLSLDDPKLEVPGNAGLKDQTMALRWIQNNCDRFGGDPSSVTLFGESAGGSSVHFHALSEMSRGLFHKAILMSGTASSPWAIVENRNFGVALAKSLGWKDDEPIEKALEILQNTDATELLNAVDTFIPIEVKREVIEPFLPIVEPYVSEQSFLPKPIAEMMLDPWSKDIPFILSATSDEGLVMGISGNLTDSYEYRNLGDFQTYVPKELASNNTARKMEYALRLKQLYYGDEEPTDQNYRHFIDLMSDTMFLRSIHMELQLRATNPSVPTYFLRFAFDSKRFNHFKINVMDLVDEPGVSHADDLSYLFKNDFYEISGGLPSDCKEFKTMQRMIALFTNFAATSNPNGAEIDDVLWEPLKTANLPYKCLNVADDLEIIDWPESNRMAVWDQLYIDDLRFVNNIN